MTPTKTTKEEVIYFIAGILTGIPFVIVALWI